MDPQKTQKGIPLTRAEGLTLILDTPKGRGIFANRFIPARTILEVSPVLVLDPQENEDHVRRTDLYNYTYNWPYNPSPKSQSQSQSQQQQQIDDGYISSTPSRSTSVHLHQPAPETTRPRAQPQPQTQAIILGLGSMFNHSSLHQNVGWERDISNLLITYTTLRDINEGEELCISYGSPARLTFIDADAEELRERDREDENDLLRTIDLID